MANRDMQDLAVRLLGKDALALDPEERNVLASIRNHSPLSRDAADVADAQASIGERLADKVAAVGGSWGFIIVFGLVLLGWMVLNTDVLGHWGLAFDAYPYIFLNLMLSMLAAIQAPIIMMSQNRQAAKDRLSASLDYEVNLRSELEVLRLHDKLDQAVSARLEAVLQGQSRIVGMLERSASPGATPSS
ncbi:DUF1003 domain-containing protein [Hephaestia sp. GCM10023244]|uniref:DUF1003 domain-containing protein n=1 Tax=unclassified Hephaestia TaxID=2631281 RepID=UPI0020777F45|nr:DUF1003 domain-containing protein [Hephaestia sp. MAHUQ-44]MCM8729885.1 DUF1003 domain-containing protein [Hephaestia sp. MAHUQ-44]